jgi:putative transposase
MNDELYKYHRHSIRLKNYDYAQPGAYFITVCTYNRECIFGEIVGANGIRPEMVLNQYGEIVREEWLKSATIRNEIELGEYIIMPNHFHAIVIIRGDKKIIKRDLNIRDHRIIELKGNLKMREGDRNLYEGDRPVAPTNTPVGLKSQSISAFMAGYKSVITKRINEIRRTPGFPVWQRNFYERVIRDEDEFNEIREYIQFNPANWEADNEYITVGVTGRSPLLTVPKELHNGHQFIYRMDAINMESGYWMY